jgi:5-(carboxyamino)imidazole ribonucleotide synthase
VAIRHELAVLVATRPDGTSVGYAPVETVQVAGICREILVPAPLPSAVLAEAEAVARRVAAEVRAVGILAVELFWDGTRILVNEVATRPHNSGHWTIEGAVTSQFANHLRAVADLPLGSTAPLTPVAVCANVLGAADGRDPRDHLAGALAVPGASVHLYGKGPRPGRKIGHVTVLGPGPRRPGRGRPRRPGPGTADMSGADAATGDPVVGIVMGSDSDWPTMEPAATALTELGIAHEVRVVSAHRTPADMLDYGRAAAPRGLQVIIAGAGGAAHLPGMLAAKTWVPVLGVPVQSKALRGLDSLLSIVQMPKGVPVATLAIGAAGAVNAALLAAAMLAHDDAAVRQALERYRAAQTAAALASALPE